MCESSWRLATARNDAPRSYSARICAHSDGDLAREAFSPPSPFFSRKRRRRDRSVDVIALSPIGVRAIGEEPFISLHEFTHDPNEHSTSIFGHSTSIFKCCSR